MVERIEKLLGDYRLDDLMQTREFHGLRGRLINIRQRINDGAGITKTEDKYIQEAEKHIQNIERRFVKMIVNGEEQSVLTSIKNNIQEQGYEDYTNGNNN